MRNWERGYYFAMGFFTGLIFIGMTVAWSVILK